MSNDKIGEHLDRICAAARPTARRLAVLTDDARRAAVLAIGRSLTDATDQILAANAADLAAGQATGLTGALLDRLRLDGPRLAAVIDDLRAIAALPDPCHRILEERTIAQGLRLRKISVPIGVIAVIYESRPNVTVDCAALCLRSGNACLLRGGTEAVHSNRALATAIRAGLAAAGIPIDAVQLVQEQDRALVDRLLKRDDAIDLVIPRGGKGLIQAVMAASTIPVVKHDKGVCSLYLHAAADPAMAVALVVNAKCQRPGVCNAIENLLVDAPAIARLLPPVGHALRERGVELRADAQARPYLPGALPATDADWETEYLDLILAVKTVTGLDEAIDFTNAHGSHHSDGIVTADAAAAERYLREVDSACVYHNASTRFTDGGQFGLGAEVGISTNRLHARGPMGIRDLCTYKYVVQGEGQIRA
jgi:glutamate-5-semialdehyde dehydrogenase